MERSSVEIRRHSVRDKPDPALSEAGWALARDLALTAPRFDRVLSSPVLRAVQTAAALGYPDPQVDAEFESVGPAVEAIVPWPSPFHAYRRALVAKEPALVLRAAELAASLTRLARQLSNEGRALVVSHGGVPELSAVALRPQDDAALWGEPCRCLEGIRVDFEDGIPQRVEVLRVDPKRTRI